MHREFPVYYFPVSSPAVPSDLQQRWFSHDIGISEVEWNGVFQGQRLQRVIRRFPTVLCYRNESNDRLDLQNFQWLTAWIYWYV